jgi:prepilin-type N-terminal cleavage/methylation domain-containing protein
MRNQKGLTLIEVMVAISIASMLTFGLERLLSTALTSWRLAIEEADISSLSEDTIRRLLEGDYDLPGIRDAVEVLKIEEEFVSFVPLWVDTFKTLPKDGNFYLSKQLRAGTPSPLAEVKFPSSRDFGTYFVTVSNDGGLKSWVNFGFPIRKGSVVRLSYHPDVRTHPELAMTFAWDKTGQRVTRTYNGEVTHFNTRKEKIKTTSLKFEYYGGNNLPVDISGKKLSERNALIRVTALKIYMTLEGSEISKEATSFVNIRALGKAGQGIILDEGLDIPIPSSKHIRLLQLVNFTGVDEGQVIELKATAPRAKSAWRLKLFLGVESTLPVLRRFEIYYPSKKMVEEADAETSLKYGLDLMELSSDGQYDYDEDEGVLDFVEFKGSEVTLSVLRSDPEGVMLIVRP